MTATALQNVRKRLLAGICLAIICCLTSVWPAVSSAGSKIDIEQQIQPAQMEAFFIYGFSNYITWRDTPGLPNPKSELYVGVVGDEIATGPIIEALETLKMKETNKQIVLSIKKFGAYRPEDDYSGIHILYISASEQDHYEEILNKMAHAPVLTVSNGESFALHGGIINFVTINHRLRFVINRLAGEAVGFEFSSRLLKTAAEVIY